MSINNERNIIRRIGILTFFILLIGGGMIWSGIKLIELEDNGNLLFWQGKQQTLGIEELINSKLEDVLDRIDSLGPVEFIDTPVDPLPVDIKGNKEDSIRNILKDILKYYEQSTTGQKATT